MPLVSVSVFRGRDASQKRALLEAVHEALVRAFGIPQPDRNIRLNEYAPEDWLLPEGKSDKYTLVEVFAFLGRSPEAKGALFARLVENLGALGTPPGDVFVIVVEQPRENWGIRGGQRADLVDLGYKVTV